jgi:hypothetical protein
MAAGYREILVSSDYNGAKNFAYWMYIRADFADTCTVFALLDLKRGPVDMRCSRTNIRRPLSMLSVSWVGGADHSK